MSEPLSRELGPEPGDVKIGKLDEAHGPYPNHFDIMIRLGDGLGAQKLRITEDGDLLPPEPRDISVPRRMSIPRPDLPPPPPAWC